MKLGVIVGLGDDPEAALKKVRDLALPTCQLACWDPAHYTKDGIRTVKEARQRYGVEISSIWAGYPGPSVWNFIQGPTTIGLVPKKWRRVRIEALKAGADFAASLGVPTISTHCGFIPENPNDPVYGEVIAALKEVVAHCRRKKVAFTFETGQETPVVLLRCIEDLGFDRLGINFDTANLILYGKANPVDALDVIGKYVMGVHAKDGFYPTNGRELGHEAPLGEGKVNFPAFIPKLKKLGYRGALTIEREISGPKQIEDIERAKRLLGPLL
ncbi:MAG: sugar phosphate isomerase/epimerase [Verrucomicrobiae bacterium]|nr:sugar phosphate isomerase/epimerase [Verrucomicrobiae bacterium]